MQQKLDCPEGCFQGSTEFYDSADTDEFTPSYLIAQPLVDNVGHRQDGSIPPWMQDDGRDPERTRKLSPCERYVEWFNGIWHTGDPSTWDATVFTNDAVMIDPTGVSRGAKQAAASFVRLFEFYPDLRGEVVSWAANDREIFINWRFQVIRKDSQPPLLVAVIDKFCFVDGRVSFRLAYFDLTSLAGYLSENFGQDHLYDYLLTSMSSAEATGGIQNLPKILWSFFKGLFLWFPPATPSGLKAISDDGKVLLEWPPVEGAVYYRVCRATSIAGPYESITGPFMPTAHGAETIHYEDRDVVNGTAYWYTVTPFFGQWRSVPAKRIAPDVRRHRRRWTSLH